jgi:cytochrome b6-f complex iron-sulfur subunit
LAADSKRHESRREFCARTCSAATLAVLGGVLGGTLQACGGGASSSPTSPGGASTKALPTVTGTGAGNTITVAIDAGSVLAATGAVALVQSAVGNVLVARTGPDVFTALSDVCTHEGCAITAHSGSTFVCLCHGAEFDSEGQVVGGPARTALRQYTTAFADNVLTIQS